MPYTPSKYGLLAYGKGPYSAGVAGRVDLVLRVGGDSVMRANANASTGIGNTGLWAISGVAAPLSLNLGVSTGALTGNSSMSANLRPFWQEQPASECGGDAWTLAPPPCLICPEPELEEVDG